jgi:hypothetical protein
MPWKVSASSAIPWTFGAERPLSTPFAEDIDIDGKDETRTIRRRLCLGDDLLGMRPFDDGLKRGDVRDL